jgi:hypothetical protein
MPPTALHLLEVAHLLVTLAILLPQTLKLPLAQR